MQIIKIQLNKQEKENIASTLNIWTTSHLNTQQSLLYWLIYSPHLQANKRGLAGQFNCKQIEACKRDCGSRWMWLLGYARIDFAEEITEIKILLLNAYWSAAECYRADCLPIDTQGFSYRYHCEM